MAKRFTLRVDLESDKGIKDGLPKLLNLFYGKIKNIPMTILGKNKMPIIEYSVSRGKTDKEIFEIIKKNIKSENLSSFYMHGLFEARFKIQLLEKIFKFINKEKIKVNRIIDY